MLKPIVFKGLLCSVLFCSHFAHSQNSENKVPEVRFIAPKEGKTFKWNDLVTYEISISDQEDGETEYDEININEVFLVVKFLKNSENKEDYLIAKNETNFEPVVEMGVRSCFNCHKLNKPLIGPSFNKIAERYVKKPETIEILAKKIISGGSQVWGDVIMPSHPDLTLESAKKIVNWIFTNNFNDEKEIIVGTKGSFRIKKSTEKSESGIYVLTAFYTDHGINLDIQSRKRGQQIITLKLE